MIKYIVLLLLFFFGASYASTPYVMGIQNNTNLNLLISISRSGVFCGSYNSTVTKEDGFTVIHLGQNWKCGTVTNTQLLLSDGLFCYAIPNSNLLPNDMIFTFTQHNSNYNMSSISTNDHTGRQYQLTKESCGNIG